MREENVTMYIIAWLKQSDWKIVAFDYPGSGTGIRLHKNGTHYKNKDTIVPDIIAVKDGIALFFENKDHFYKKDFEKQYSNINEKLFSDDVNKILKPYKISNIKWGIGIPETKYSKNVNKHEYMVDFLYTVEENGGINQKKYY
jgi:hypothetical protein